MKISKDFEDIIGQEQVKKQVKSALLMNRHIILVGQPGMGKTTLARNIARLLPSIKVNNCGYNCKPSKPVCPSCRKGKKKVINVKGSERFIRIQGSPDLTAEDLIGDIDPIKALKYGALSLEAFTPGKIFRANNGILFFDEVNRAPEKLQNALLQVLEENKATIGSYNIDLPADFIAICTMNPEDFSGTEKLSDVFLDRFDIIYMGYPENLDIEKEIVFKKGKKLDVEFPNNLLEGMLKFIRNLRDDERLDRVPSVRASLGLYERSQANALLENRNKVRLNDIKEAVVSVIAHRIKLKPSVKYLMKPEEFLRKEFERYMERGNKERGDYP